MGRKRNAIVIKEIKKTGLTIVFYDSKSIYIFNKEFGWSVFHRWGAPLGSYRSWRKFRHLMWYAKRIDYRHCFRLAFRYDISSQKAKKGPILDENSVIERISI